MDMSIEDYLAQGGVLSNPTNVPPRYRAELLKLMTSFVDSELAGAAGFADIINEGPGIKERIAAARIVLEKTDHAGKVLRVMEGFGVDSERYANHHPWTARLDRDADIGTTRGDHDMRLVMNLLMGCAVAVQLADYTSVSYQPLAEAFREIAPVEARHADLAEEGLQRLMGEGEGEAIVASIGYWFPRVAASFGQANSPRYEMQKQMGLRQRSNDEMRAEWEAKALAALDRVGIQPG